MSCRSVDERAGFAARRWLRDRSGDHLQETRDLARLLALFRFAASLRRGRGFSSRRSTISVIDHARANLPPCSRVRDPSRRANAETHAEAPAAPTRRRSPEVRRERRERRGRVQRRRLREARPSDRERRRRACEPQRRDHLRRRHVPALSQICARYRRGSDRRGHPTRCSGPRETHPSRARRSSSPRRARRKNRSRRVDEPRHPALDQSLHEHAELRRTEIIRPHHSRRIHDQRLDAAFTHRRSRRAPCCDRTRSDVRPTARARALHRPIRSPARNGSSAWIELTWISAHARCCSTPRPRSAVPRSTCTSSIAASSRASSEIFAAR